MKDTLARITGKLDRAKGTVTYTTYVRRIDQGMRDRIPFATSDDLDALLDSDSQRAERSEPKGTPRGKLES